LATLPSGIIRRRRSPPPISPSLPKGFADAAMLMISTGRGFVFVVHECHGNLVRVRFR
jgi:hypothetical protein